VTGPVGLGPAVGNHRTSDPLLPEEFGRSAPGRPWVGGAGDPGALVLSGPTGTDPEGLVDHLARWGALPGVDGSEPCSGPVGWTDGVEAGSPWPARWRPPDSPSGSPWS